MVTGLSCSAAASTSALSRRSSPIAASYSWTAARWAAVSPGTVFHLPAWFWNSVRSSGAAALGPPAPLAPAAPLVTGPGRFRLLSPCRVVLGLVARFCGIPAAPLQQARQEPGGAGLPDDDVDRAALAPYLGVLEITVGL
jgi:hypothetical protein